MSPPLVHYLSLESFFFIYFFFWNSRKFYWTKSSKKLEKIKDYNVLIQAETGLVNQASQVGFKLLFRWQIHEWDKIWISSIRVSLRGGFWSKQTLLRYLQIVQVVVQMTTSKQTFVNVSRGTEWLHDRRSWSCLGYSPKPHHFLIIIQISFATIHSTKRCCAVSGASLHKGHRVKYRSIYLEYQGCNVLEDDPI